MPWHQVACRARILQLFKQKSAMTSSSLSLQDTVTLKIQQLWLTPWRPVACHSSILQFFYAIRQPWHLPRNPVGIVSGYCKKDFEQKKTTGTALASSSWPFPGYRDFSYTKRQPCHMPRHPVACRSRILKIF
jgi:hypothetical protein